MDHSAHGGGGMGAASAPAASVASPKKPRVPPEMAAFLAARMGPEDLPALEGAVQAEEDVGTSGAFAQNLDSAAAMMRGEQPRALVIPRDNSVRNLLLKKQAEAATKPAPVAPEEDPDSPESIAAVERVKQTPTGQALLLALHERGVKPHAKLLNTVVPIPQVRQNLGDPEERTFKDKAREDEQAFRDAQAKNEAVEREKDRASREKTAGASAHAMGGDVELSPESLDMAARVYATTGQLPALGSRAAGARAAIMKRAGELYPGADIAGNKATLHADSSSLASQQKLLDLTKSWEVTGKANLGVLRGVSGELANSGSPLANRPLRWLYEKAGGDPTVTKFKAAHAAVVNEYAKILSGATGSAGVTDAARREAEEMLPLDATPAQIAAAADVLERDAGNRLSALEQGVTATRKRMGGRVVPKGSEPQTVRVRYQGKILEIPAARLSDALKDGAEEVK